jgi:putative transposase
MPRRRRVDKGGMIYHVINRRVGRAVLFSDDGDYAAFERVIAEAGKRFPGVRVLAYCSMPNHWHLVVWPRRDGELSRYMQWVTVTHMRRWHEHRRSVGTGPVYQGRFKSFPVQEDGHFLTVCRYVERNPVRAKLVRRAASWRWSSAGVAAAARADKRAARTAGHDGAGGTEEARKWLTRRGDWPVRYEGDWSKFVDEPQTDAEVAEVRRSVNRGTPFGEEGWRRRTAARLGLESSLRERGRPRKEAKEEEEEKGGATS